MADLQTMADLADVISGSTVIGAILFGLFQIHEIRMRRRHDATLQLVHSFETPQFARAVFLVATLPEGLNREELEKRLGTQLEDLWLLATTWASLGILVFRRELSLGMVEDFFNGPIPLSWRKMARLAEDVPKESGRPTYFEWFQWLAERLGERERVATAIPASVEHRA